MPEHENLLTAWEVYRSQIINIPNLSDDEMHRLAMKAKEEEEAKELFLKYCIRFAIYDSLRFTQFVYSYDEHMDLVGAANEKIAKAMDQALAKREPVPYIRAAIKNALIDHSVFHKKFVKNTISLEMLGLDTSADKTQLPKPVAHAEKSERVGEMLNALTEKQRYVVIRYFGLDGQPAETLYALSKRLSSTGRNTGIAKRRFQLAVKRLQHTFV